MMGKVAGLVSINRFNSNLFVDFFSAISCNHRDLIFSVRSSNLCVKYNVISFASKLQNSAIYWKCYFGRPFQIFDVAGLLSDIGEFSAKVIFIAKVAFQQR